MSVAPEANVEAGGEVEAGAQELNTQVVEVPIAELPFGILEPV
jgi:hypothetical protein